MYEQQRHKAATHLQSEITEPTCLSSNKDKSAYEGTSMAAPMTAGTAKTVTSIASSSVVYQEILELIKPSSPEIDLTKMTMKTWNQQMNESEESRSPEQRRQSVKMKLTDRLWSIGSKRTEQIKKMSQFHPD